jgi:hypothetical protein
MGEAQLPRYFRCVNCSRYMEVDDSIDSAFCSDECRQRYARCHTCGRYFAVPSAEDPLYCSEECAVTEDAVSESASVEYRHMNDEESATDMTEILGITKRVDGTREEGEEL